MTWGTGPTLGLLTVFSYLLFLSGAALMWRSRADFSVWFHDELSFFRRNFSRYTPAGPFYAIREESRFKAISVLRPSLDKPPTLCHPHPDETISHCSRRRVGHSR